MDYATRLERLHELMVRNDMDGLVYGLGANLQYFTGLCATAWERQAEPAEPDCLLLLATGQVPRVIANASVDTGESDAPVELHVVESTGEVVAGLAEYFGRARGETKRIGTSRVAEPHLRKLLERVAPSAEVLEAESLGESLRMCKDADEIAVLRRVVALTDRVMERVVPRIRPGITQPQLQQIIADEGEALGADDVSFSPAALFVKSGTEPTADPFVYPREEGLVAGTSIAFDFGFILDGYCSDFGRSFYCGPAPDYVSGAYRALQEAQCKLISLMKPGRMTLGELFGLLEKELDELGYGDRLRARLSDGTLGHQIGVDLHENPWVRPGCDVVLQPGMVMAIEPKLWLPGEYYVRVEDIVLVTEDGAESLTLADRELFELPV